MPFRLVTLGELSLYAPDHGRKLAVPRKGLALLAVLASSGGRAVSREKVAPLLWPEAEDSGRGALKQTLYELRQTLGKQGVVLGSTDLTLDPTEITSDVGDLEAARGRKDWISVTELYAGPFLDRFHVRGAVEFDHWVDSHRDRYRGIFCDALERSARDASERGDHPAATTLWRRLATEDPFNSRVALGLLDALSNAGDPAGALTHYRVHEDLLRAELGVPPDPALTAAAEKIRAGNGTPGQPKSHATVHAADAHRLEQVSTPASYAPLPLLSSKRVWRGNDPRFWFSVVLLLVIAGGLAAAWPEEAPARVVGSVPIPLNSSSRVNVDLHLNKVFIDGGASFDHALTVVDGGDLRSHSLPHGAGVAVDPLTGWVWSGDYGGHFVVVRNGRTNAEIGRVKVPGCPHHIAIDGQRTWVAQQCEDYISVIDSRTRMTVRHIPIPTLSRDEVGGAKGMGEILVNRTTGIVYFWKDMIPHRLDPRSWQMRETPGIDGPIFAVNEPANRLYARVDNGLQVIDGHTEKVIGHVKLPATPARVAVGFGGRRVYVATAQQLSAVDGTTHRVLWTMPFPNDFIAYGLAADDGRHRLYVLGTNPDGTNALKILALKD